MGDMFLFLLFSTTVKFVQTAEETNLRPMYVNLQYFQSERDDLLTLSTPELDFLLILVGTNPTWASKGLTVLLGF